MGTSTSSKGPQGGVSFDPPWLDQITTDIQPSGNDISDTNDVIQSTHDQDQIESDTPRTNVIEISPIGRFAPSRAPMREFLRNGGKQNFRKVAGNYSKTGMGGAKKLSSRMRVATTVGSNLFGLIQNIQNIPSIQNWLTSLNGKTPNFRELENQIINILIPDGGSVDEDSCRDSLSKAMSDLYEIDPDIDLQNIQQDEIWFLIERFLASECLNRLCHDIGQAMESSEFKPEVIVQRLDEMKSYLEADLKSNLEVLRANLANPSNKELQQVLEKSLEHTFSAYEGEI
ncbi:MULTISPECIES: Qat anti-phage system associated protein QatB [Acinetobacter calcoaceticus/baumannii complex]|uniref:Qat anti-phage system associated protein QatB n=1 Tax=Acinetobacter calcoaceticus/baumannii complex TaxID=909768 RepID=UPI000669322E|nr:MULTISPECIES: Qat anti-phage system associated protein QatB [Acinetobacter calcoaceticus/baumannii complex]EHU3264594.1 hypothetical protein [Acinetobacter baumannii]ELA7823383.1 hypothetical protein [Acinetobacter baumannii]MCH2053988.1 hypothetical protein [Acinetobacter pittii]MCL6696770.1 hypothetical protein [Acinetobacter baumannii]SSV46811.1 Uncharacterised protein [Acinetobacter nosocomialis]